MWHKCNWAGIFTGLFVEAIGFETVNFFESLKGGGIYGNFSAMGHVGAWIQGYFCQNWWALHVGAFKKSWRYVILIKLGKHVNEIMADAVKKFQYF